MINNEEVEIDNEDARKAIFAEHLAQITGKTPDNLNPPAISVKESPEEQAESESTAATAIEPTNSDTPSEISPQLKVEDTKATSSTEESASKDDKLSFVNELPDDVKSKVLELVKEKQEIENKFRSASSRQGAFQKHYETERKKRSELEAQLALHRRPSVATPQNPTQSDLQAYTNSLPPTLKELVEADPKLVEAMKEHAEMRETVLLSQVEQLVNAKVNPINEASERQSKLRVVEELHNYIPNLNEIVYAVDSNGVVQTDERGIPYYSDHWTQFRNELPQAYRAAIDNINTAEEGVFAINHLYSQWAAQKNASFQPQQAPSPVQPVNVDTSQADKILEKRQKDLKRVTPQGTLPPLNATLEADLSNPKIRDMEFAKALKAVQAGNPSLYR